MISVELTLGATGWPSSWASRQLVPTRSVSPAPSARAGVDSKASVAAVSRLWDSMVASPDFPTGCHAKCGGFHGARSQITITGTLHAQPRCSSEAGCREALEQV